MRKLPRGISLRRDRYFVRIGVEGKTQYVGDYDTLREAEMALSLARADVIRGTFKSAKQKRKERKARENAEQKERVAKLTCGQWFDTFLERTLQEVDRGEKTMGTYREYASRINVHVRPILGDMTLREVTPDDIKALITGILATSPTAGARQLRT